MRYGLFLFPTKDILNVRAYSRLLAVFIAILFQLLPTAAEAAQSEPIEARARDAFVTSMNGLADAFTAATEIAEAREPRMTCPVPSATFISSWGAPRSGHTHQGVDMMADFGTQILAPESGHFEGDGESFYLHADSGTTYFGTHNGGDLVPNGPVTRGQPISTVSNTGNASGGSPHLHFEIHPGGGEPVDPYPATFAACTAPAPLPPGSMAAVAETSRTNSITPAERRFCRYVNAGLGPRFFSCLHQMEGHRQGQPGHLWSDYVRQSRQFRRFLRGLAPRTCSGPSDCPALIRAAFDHMGVGYRASEAVSVARCESTLDPRATNGSHDGLFQQSRSYWGGRSAQYGMAGRSAYDPWANAVVSAGMVRDTGGWSHWSCRP